jgi:acetyl esterase/lipase
MKTPPPPTADADMQAVLDALTALAPPPIGTVSPADQRAAPTPADAVKRVMTARGRSTTPEPGVTTRDVSYPGAAGRAIKARVYTPEGATGRLPVILYFHGGGWVIANLDVYDAAPRALAKQAQAIVVSASYRQAPEAKFPAAHDDANAAYKWVLANAGSWGGDPRRVAVAGESAGGNLAANVAIFARDNGLQAPVHQLLVYPVAGTDVNTASYQRDAAAAPLGKGGMQWFMHYVTRTPADAQDPRLNLVAANLKGLPPATIVAAEIDPLLSEGERLESRLRDAGVAVERRVYEGATHEFFGMAAVVRDAYDAQAYAVERLRAAFAASAR